MRHADFVASFGIGSPRSFSIKGVAHLLLFMFPLFAVSMRHWLSSIFAVLCLLGFVAMVRHGGSFWKVGRHEWIFMGLVAAFFVSFLVTALANGWDEHATRALGTELRFLLIFPLYLLIRQIPNAIQSLVWGCLFGVMLNLGLVIFEMHGLGLERANGVYGPLFVGPVTVLMASLVVLGLQTTRPRITVALQAGAMLSAILVATYSSRSALLGVFVLALFVLLVRAGRHRWIYFLLLFAAAGMAVHSHKPTHARLDAAAQEVIGYVKYEQANDGLQANASAIGPVGIRLEMVKASYCVVREFPVFGVGRYGYAAYVEQKIEQGKLNASVGEHGHPHNMFLAALFFKGLIGFAVVVTLFAYLLWFFARRSTATAQASHAGIAAVLALLAAGATESAILIKGNFIAVFLVVCSVLVATHVARTRGHEGETAARSRIPAGMT